jgi:hypothetical protein
LSRFEILTCRLTKKGSAVRANCWLRLFGVVDVLCKVVHGPDGPFLALPTGEYKGADGRTRYLRRVKVTDEDLLRAIEEAVLDRYRAALVEHGRRGPA